MTEIDNDRKRAVLTNQIELWKNTQYNAVISEKVAKKIGNEQMVAAAIEELKRCEIALDVLNEELAGLEGDG